MSPPDCRPFVGLEGRNLRDGEVYTPVGVLEQIFLCFIFSTYVKSFSELDHHEHNSLVLSI